MALMGAGWFGFVSDDVVCLLSYNLLGRDWDVMCFIRLLLASQAVCMFCSCSLESAMEWILSRSSRSKVVK